LLDFAFVLEGLQITRRGCVGHVQKLLDMVVGDTAALRDILKNLVELLSLPNPFCRVARDG
jgi:hypothetical protein